MDTFDPDVFMQTRFTEPTETKRTPCPLGEYPAIVEKVEVREWHAKDGQSDGVAYDVLCSIEDEGVKAALGRDKVLSRYSVMFTYLPGTREIDQKKAKSDIGFGKFRAALGLNEGEFAWAMAPGRMLKVRIAHEVYKGEPKDYIEAVTKL